MHNTPLITTIVAGLVIAFVFGALANRLRLSPLVGYLIAGVLFGRREIALGMLAEATGAREGGAAIFAPREA